MKKTAIILLLMLFTQNISPMKLKFKLDESVYTGKYKAAMHDLKGFENTSIKNLGKILNLLELKECDLNNKKNIIFNKDIDYCAKCTIPSLILKAIELSDSEYKASLLVQQFKTLQFNTINLSEDSINYHKNNYSFNLPGSIMYTIIKCKYQKAREGLFQILKNLNSGLKNGIKYKHAKFLPEKSIFLHTDIPFAASIVRTIAQDDCCQELQNFLYYTLAENNFDLLNKCNLNKIFTYKAAYLINPHKDVTLYQKCSLPAFIIINIAKCKDPIKRSHLCEIFNNLKFEKYNLNQSIYHYKNTQWDKDKHFKIYDLIIHKISQCNDINIQKDLKKIAGKIDLIKIKNLSIDEKQNKNSHEETYETVNTVNNQLHQTESQEVDNTINYTNNQHHQETYETVNTVNNQHQIKHQKYSAIYSGLCSMIMNLSWTVSNHDMKKNLPEIAVKAASSGVLAATISPLLKKYTKTEAIGNIMLSSTLGNAITNISYFGVKKVLQKSFKPFMQNNIARHSLPHANKNHPTWADLSNISTLTPKNITEPVKLLY